MRGANPLDRMLHPKDGAGTSPWLLLDTEPYHIERAKLEDIAERTIGQTNIKRIWVIIQAAQESGQGATIVVSKDPEPETSRLSGEDMPIEPDYLEPEDVVRLGSVDGAVILGPDGRCHAFGVILDGVATKVETALAGRGSTQPSATKTWKQQHQ